MNNHDMNSDNSSSGDDDDIINNNDDSFSATMAAVAGMAAARVRTSQSLPSDNSVEQVPRQPNSSATASAPAAVLRLLRSGIISEEVVSLLLRLSNTNNSSGAEPNLVNNAGSGGGLEALQALQQRQQEMFRQSQRINESQEAALLQHVRRLLGREHVRNNHETACADLSRRLEQPGSSVLATLSNNRIVDIESANVYVQGVLEEEENRLRSLRSFLQRQLESSRAASAASNNVAALPQHAPVPSAAESLADPTQNSSHDSASFVFQLLEAGATSAVSTARVAVAGDNSVDFKSNSSQVLRQKSASPTASSEAPPQAQGNLKDDGASDAEENKESLPCAEDEMNDDQFFQTFDTQDSHLMNNETFPFRLYRMLYEIEQSGQQDIISFSSSGKVIVIHKPKKFVEGIMPKYFNTTRLASFQRQLNLYGFQRINEGRLRGGYHHNFFQKGKRHLCRGIKRQKTRIPKKRASTTTSSTSSPVPLAPLEGRSAPQPLTAGSVPPSASVNPQESAPNVPSEPERRDIVSETLLHQRSSGLGPREVAAIANANVLRASDQGLLHSALAALQQQINTRLGGSGVQRPLSAGNQQELAFRRLLEAAGQRRLSPDVLGVLPSVSASQFSQVPPAALVGSERQGPAVASANSAELQQLLLTQIRQMQQSEEMERRRQQQP